MKNIKKFEAFIIPKPLRKFHPWWKDEEIALNILDELKKIQKSRSIQSVNDLEIKKQQNEYNKFTFRLDDFSIDVDYRFIMTPGGGRDAGEMILDGVQLEVSDEVCRKICNVLRKLISLEDELLKKDFKIRRRMI